jgi:hypothetical protein
MKYVVLLAGSFLLMSCSYERVSLPAAPSATFVQPATYTITGTVRDTAGRAIESADIFMVVTTRGAPAWKTDAAGQYRIRVPGGAYSFTISKRGYRRLVATVRVDGDTTANFVLAPENTP